jgi:two-component system chemotaxis response regulator CheY
VARSGRPIADSQDRARAREPDQLTYVKKVRNQMRIVVADDESVSRKVLRKALEVFGRCEEAEDGREATAAFKRAWDESSPFDLLMLDFSMPEMDGREVVHQIRGLEKDMKVPHPSQVKIVMVTSHSEEDTVLSCLRAGCNDFIVKPFDQKVLFEKLARLGFDRDSFPTPTPCRDSEIGESRRS